MKGIKLPYNIFNYPNGLKIDMTEVNYDCRFDQYNLLIDTKFIIPMSPEILFDCEDVNKYIKLTIIRALHDISEGLRKNINDEKTSNNPKD